jgi:hypothetical protein
MNRMLRIATTAFALGLIVGCGGKSAKPTAPTPSSNSQEIEPNDATPQALGTLGSTDIEFTGSCSSASDVDLYSVVVPGSMSLFVSTSWTGSSDLDLAVLNGSKVFLNVQDTGANPEQCTLGPLAAATYVVRVTEKSSAATSYTLTIGAR